MTKARTLFGALGAVMCIVVLVLSAASPVYAHHRDGHAQGDDRASEGERFTDEEDPEGKRYDGEGEPRGESESSCPNEKAGTDDGGGANTSGPYDNTCDGDASKAGNGGGSAQGRPCAGCVGNADDKNPPGQMRDGNHDGNAGYECDANNGVGRSNPAHTACEPPDSTQGGGGGLTPMCPSNPNLPLNHPGCGGGGNGGGGEVAPVCPSNPNLPLGHPGCNEDDVLGETTGDPDNDRVLSRVVVNRSETLGEVDDPRGSSRRMGQGAGVLPFTGAGDVVLLFATALLSIVGGSVLLSIRRLTN